MVFNGVLSPQKRAYVALLSKDKAFKPKEICQTAGVSRATVYRIKKEERWQGKERKSPKKGGRPKKLSARDERKILRSMKSLRKEEGSFSSRRIMTTAGLCSSNVSNRTVRRCLNKHGYFNLQARKKGLLSESDCQKRLKFAKKMKKEYPANVWTHEMAFYLDGVSFTYKRRPKDQALAPRGRVWRKKSEGLKRGCTSKGSKEGTGGKLVKLIVATSYDKGVIEVYEYEHLDGPAFAAFIKERFRGMFERAGKTPSRLFLQDNAPNQNCACVRGALRRAKAKQLDFPPRSGDLNPIENLFKRVKDLLHKQAVRRDIKYETYHDFKARVIDTLRNFSIAEHNKTIESMNKRIDMVIANKGDRTKY